MAYEMKDNSGTLFKNDDKTKDTHPNAKGSAIIDGVEYWVSAWTKDGKKGKYQSLSFKRKDEASTQRMAVTKSAIPKNNDMPLDDIPF